MMAHTMSKPMSTKQIQDQEKEWRAESDVRTLIEAAKICGDKERHKLALNKVSAMRAELDDIKSYEKS